MISLVWRTDVHLSDKPPVSRVDDWSGAVLGKLRQVGKVASHVKAQAVLDGGDFFHIKSPSRTTHSLIRKVADLHNDYPCPIYCTPGNHDAVYGDYGYLGQQPLGVLFSTGVFLRLYDEHEAVFCDDEVKVRVIGIPYHGTKYDHERLQRIEKGDEDWLVCVAHVLASSQGGSMFGGEDIWKYQDMARFPPDLWALGHWHKDQGVQEVDGKQFVNLGSLSRGALVQDDLERKPACAVLSFTKDQIQVRVVRLKVKPSGEIFDLDGRARQESREMTMDSFVESIRDRLVLDQQEDIEDVLRGMANIPDQVREQALLYLERSA